MIIRTKTKWRLLFLLVLLLVGAVAAGGFYALRKQQIRRSFIAARDHGMESFQHGDFKAAIPQLERYVKRYPNDADVLFCLAKARRNVPLPDRRHIYASVGLLRHVVELSPDNLEARRLLLTLYSDLGYNTEIIDAAQQLLQRDPKDALALACMAKGKAGLQQWKEALEYARRSDAVDPSNIEIQVLTLLLLDESGAKEQVLPRAVELLSKHPNDSRFELVMAIACNMSHEWPQAPVAALRSVAQKRYPEAKSDQWDRHAAAEFFIRRAAREIPSDIYYIQALVAEWDRLGLPQESLQLLERAQLSHSDPWFRQLLARRLFQANRFADVDKVLASIKPEDEDADPEMLGLRAVSLLRLGKKDLAAPIVKSLDARTDSHIAAAWASIVRELLLKPDGNASACVAAIREALPIQRDSLFLRYYLAEASIALGEKEQAAELLGQVHAFSPFWSLPLMRLSRVALELNQPARALTAAQLAQQCAPNDINAAINLAVVLSSTLDQTDSTRSAQVLELVSRIQKLIPSEPQTLPAYIRLLGRSGQRESAAKALEQAISQDTKMDAATLARLAGVSQELSLGLEDRCFELSEKLHGMTPELALMKASNLLVHHKPAEGLALLEQASKAANASTQWRLVRARYLELSHDSRAAAEWASLADDPALSKDLLVQREVLRAASAWTDRKLIDRTISRVQSLTGERAAAWRIARAHWLLEQPDARNTAEALRLLNEAITTVPNDPPARQLMALAMERSGNLRGAADQLTAVLRLIPNSVPNVLELARLYHLQGEYERAAQLIEQIPVASLDSNQRRQAAALLIEQGGFDRARDILGHAAPSTSNSGPSDRIDAMMLVELHWRKHETKAAAEILQKLLEKPDLAAIMSAADFYAATGRPDEAQKTLALLSDLKLASGQREFSLAQFELRHGSQAKATEFLAAAAKAAPNNAAYVRALIHQRLVLNQVPEAMAAAEQAAEELPTEAWLSSFRKIAPRIKASPTPQVLALAAAILEQPDDADTAVQAITLLDSNRHAPAASYFTRLHSLADNAPRLFALQKVAINAALTLHRQDDAAQLASRALRTFPSSPDAAQLVATTFAAAHNFRQALAAAGPWRELRFRDPLTVDLFMAEMDLQLHDYPAALKQIEPYAIPARQQPDQFLPVIAIQCRVLIAEKQTQKALELLLPQLSHSRQWRELALQLSAEVEENPAAIAWVNAVASTVPNQTPDQLQLASAWRAIAVRFNDQSSANRAVELLTSLASRSDASPDVFLELAMLEERGGDLAAAQASYRSVLRLSPDNVIAQNNLAMLLARTGHDLPEALALASKAAQAQPGIADVHDTLAFVQMKCNDPKAAAASLRAALSLDPDNLKFKVSLASALLAAGDASQANQLLAQIDSVVSANATLSSDLEKQIESLRKSLRR